ncbi:MAG TPA: hypothetical protein VF614_15575, partial [Chthoniobacteraceae bacterium]
MKVNHTTLIVTLSTLAFAASVGRAETIHLTDGTVLEGELSAPSEVVVKTAEGERRVAFSLLSPDAQKAAWAKWTVANTKADAAPAVAAATNAPLSEEELSGLASEVSLDTWAQVAAIGSFRDKPEKRGVGGLVVTKAFNALDENWTSVYPESNLVGQARDWSEQVARAKALQSRTTQFMQRRWLELFIKAGEAVARRDSNEFALCVRELKRSNLTATAE